MRDEKSGEGGARPHDPAPAKVDRRTALKRIAVGAAALSVPGALTGCFPAPGQYGGGYSSATYGGYGSYGSHGSVYGSYFSSWYSSQNSYFSTGHSNSYYSSNYGGDYGSYEVTYYSYSY